MATSTFYRFSLTKQGEREHGIKSRLFDMMMKMVKRRYKKRQASLKELQFAFLLIGLLLVVSFTGSISSQKGIWVVSSIVSLLILSGAIMTIIRMLNSYQKQQALRALELAHIDEMKGEEFEHYLAAVFKDHGYHVSTTRSTGDFGVDLMITRDGIKTAVQIKNYTGKVNLKAVQEVVAGQALSIYKGQKCMVVTNSYYTKSAYTLAKANNCELIDRIQLGKWIHDFQNRN